MAETYTITMKNCAFFARHGFHEQEAFLGQRFFVDVDLEVAAGQTLETDEIDGTVDYGVAFTAIEAVMTTTRRKLIETLAMDIARMLCERFPSVRRAGVTVRKPSAPIQGVLDYVQVRVEHSN